MRLTVVGTNRYQYGIESVSHWKRYRFNWTNCIKKEKYLILDIIIFKRNFENQNTNLAEQTMQTLIQDTPSCFVFVKMITVDGGTFLYFIIQ